MFTMQGQLDIFDDSNKQILSTLRARNLVNHLKQKLYHCHLLYGVKERHRLHLVLVIIFVRIVVRCKNRSHDYVKLIAKAGISQTVFHSQKDFEVTETSQAFSHGISFLVGCVVPESSLVLNYWTISGDEQSVSSITEVVKMGVVQHGELHETPKWDKCSSRLQITPLHRVAVLPSS